MTSSRGYGEEIGRVGRGCYEETAPVEFQLIDGIYATAMYTDNSRLRGYTAAAALSFSLLCTWYQLLKLEDRPPSRRSVADCRRRRSGAPLSLIHISEPTRPY